MHRALALIVLCSTLAACEQDVATVGFDMSDFFPFDNGREWTFSNLDEDLDYVIDATLDVTAPVELDNGDQAFVIRYEKRCFEGVEECGAGPLYDLYMSDTSVYGIAVHGYETPETGKVMFEERLLLAKPKMGRGEVVESSADEHTFTSTFFDLEKDGTIGAGGEPIADELGCDQDVGVDWECVHIVVESDPPGHWLAGDWWATAGWNIVAWNRSNDVGKWRTIDAGVYVPPEEGGE